jgi:hypothetical protein
MSARIGAQQKFSPLSQILTVIVAAVRLETAAIRFLQLFPGDGILIAASRKVMDGW